MSRLPFIEWWVADYLSDYKTARLDNEQDGCYRRLLDHMWHDFDEQCIFPLDYAALGGIWRMCPEAAEAMLDSLQTPARCALFEVRSRRGQPVLFSKRLHAQKVKASSRHEERSSSGKKGAARRWSKHHGSANGSAMQQPMANDGITESYPELEKEPVPSRSSEPQRQERGSYPQAEPEGLPGILAYFSEKVGGRELSSEEVSWVRRHAKRFGCGVVGCVIGDIVPERGVDLPYMSGCVKNWGKTDPSEAS